MPTSPDSAGLRPQASGLQPPQIVFFDAAWTIIRPEPSVGLAYAQIAREFGHEVDDHALDRAFRIAWRRAREGRSLPYGTTESQARQFWAEVVARTFDLAGASHIDTTHFFHQTFDRFGTEEFWRLYDDVIPALEILRDAGVPAGVLSNFDSRLHNVLARLGVADCFRVIIPSSEAGVEKPHPDIFIHAAEKAGVPHPAVIAHIGDEIEADGHGATRAGWRTCLIDREGALNDGPLPRAANLVDAVRRVMN